MAPGAPKGEYAVMTIPFAWQYCSSFFCCQVGFISTCLMVESNQKWGHHLKNRNISDITYGLLDSQKEE